MPNRPLPTPAQATPHRMCRVPRVPPTAPASSGSPGAWAQLPLSLEEPTRPQPRLPMGPPTAQDPRLQGACPCAGEGGWGTPPISLSTPPLTFGEVGWSSSYQQTRVPISQMGSLRPGGHRPALPMAVFRSMEDMEPPANPWPFGGPRSASTGSGSSRGAPAVPCGEAGVHQARLSSLTPGGAN